MVEINENREKKKNNKTNETSLLGGKLQSVNPAESGLAIPTVWNAMDSKEWVNSD